MKDQRPSYNEAMMNAIHELFGNDHRGDGIDNTPEGIEQIRTELTKHRNKALGIGEMQYAVLMSHVIALLAELKGIKENYAKLPGTILELRAQVQADLEGMEKH